MKHVPGMRVVLLAIRRSVCVMCFTVPKLTCVAWAVVGIAFGASADAHTAVTGLGQVTVNDDRVLYRLDVVLSEVPSESATAIIAAASGADADAANRLASRLRAAILIEADGSACRPGRVRVQRSQSTDGKASLQVDFACNHAPWRLKLREVWNGFLGEHYGTIVSLRRDEVSREVMLGEDRFEAEFDLAVPPPSSWLGFVALGIEHILTGLDHVLFLLALLAPAQRLWSVVKIVTAFTVAHSVTLSLAVLQPVPVPANVVEPLIAASIVAVAAENLMLGGAPRWRWMIAFGFGLVHGLGFAGGLLELDLPTASLVPALVGFNVGVEIGQLAVVLVAYPLLRWATAPVRVPRLATALSCLVGLAGAWWLVERVFLE